jgi:two-component system, NtrC family, sensor kinase
MVENDQEKLAHLMTLGHLSAAVGHHLINAFSTVVSQSEIIRSSPYPFREPGEMDEPGERIGTMIQTALEASGVARKLIDFSHSMTSIEGGGFTGPVERLDLNRIIAELASSDDPTLGLEGKVELDLSPVPAIHGRASQVRSALLFLLRNAHEASPKGRARITVVTITDSRGWPIIEVRDTGSGMSPGVLERATEPFFTTKAGHLGIGLTIARGIWRRHRGTVSIESEPGQGTTIRLSAPAISSER